MNSISKIQLLPEHIIDQIKAGEVIERPSTLLKEIVENSIDAGATKIDIHLINNGIDLISLTDNGGGIPAADLPLAFCRHATSKISQFEDIYHLSSYGFRGEALASIASISKLTCESRTADTYGLIKIEGGETITHQAETNQETTLGTKLYIKHLFYNTPVRMKFIQSKTTEKNQLKKILLSFFIMNPTIEFSIKWDDEEKQFFKAHTFENHQKRVRDVLSIQKDLSLFVNENQYDGVSFKIFISKESTRGNAHKSHYLFINNRYVQDIQLHKIILNSATNLWPEFETGHYTAFIDVPSNELDVNIHPNKTVVKLFNPARVYSLVSSTIKQIEGLYSLKEKQNTELPTKSSSFDFMQDNPVHFQHKNIDLKTEQNLVDYFNQIHKKSNDEEGKNDYFLAIAQFSRFDLLLYHKDLYLLNKNELIRHHIKSLFNTEEEISEVIPLLVSSPIEIKKEFNKTYLDFFQRHGFELDQINTDSLLLRTFPKDFQYYPYLKFIQENLHNPSQSNLIDSFTFYFLNEFKVNEQYQLKLLHSYSLTQLLELKIIKKVEEKDLDKLYDRK